MQRLGERPFFHTVLLIEIRGFRQAIRAKENDLGQSSIVVHSVEPTGTAGLDGRIKAGDTLLSINGVHASNVHALTPPTPGKTTSCPYGHELFCGRNLVPVSGYPLLGVMP